MRENIKTSEGPKMIIAKITLFMPCSPVAQLSRAAGHQVTIMRCVPTGKEGGRSLLRVESDELDSRMLMDRLKGGGTDGTFEVTTVGQGRHIVTAEHPSCDACRALAETHCFLEEGHGEEDGTMRWTVIAPNNDELKRLKERLEDGHTRVVFESIRPLRSERELTLQQEKVIRLAFDLGYYNIPKDIDLGKLAKILDISKPTLDIMLRRAQKKILAGYLRSES